MPEFKIDEPQDSKKDQNADPKEDLKYEITDISLNYCGTTLYKIRALKDFDGIRAGDFGGYIERPSNLSQEGKAWVYDQAKVFGYAQVQDDAKVAHNAEVFDNAQITKGSLILEDAVISGNTKIQESLVTQEAKVRGDSLVLDHSIIKGMSVITEHAVIEDSLVDGYSVVRGNSKIKNSQVIGSIVNDTQIDRSVLRWDKKESEDIQDQILTNFIDSSEYRFDERLRDFKVSKEHLKNAIILHLKENNA